MDSLAAVELTAAIEDELGIELPLTAVHEHPSLDALCRFIEGDGADERASASWPECDRTPCCRRTSSRRANAARERATLVEFS